MIVRLKFITLLTLSSIINLFAVEILLDTALYAANGSVYSITKYEDTRVTGYNEFYITGDDKYSISYLYQNDTLRTERLYKADGTEYAYGEYSYTADNYTYSYYSSNGELLTVSTYSAAGLLLRYNKMSPDGTIYWYGEYSYSDVGWLTGEIYYNSQGVNDAEAVWSFDSASGITEYHYTLMGDSLLTNVYTGDVYDEYRTYYSNSLSLKDSTAVFYNGSRVYSSHFLWNENGYMLSDKHYGSGGELTSEGSYSFDNSNFTTTYKYSYVNDNTEWKTVTDYRGLTEKIDVSQDNKLVSSTKYRYNELLYTDSVYYYGVGKELLAIDKYEYYEPYEWVKRYLYAGASGDTIAYYEYAMDGTITHSVVSNPHTVSAKNSVEVYIKQLPGSIILSGVDGQKGNYLLCSMSGRVVKSGKILGRSSLTVNTSMFSKGVYLLSIKTPNGSSARPLIIK